MKTFVHTILKKKKLSSYRKFSSYPHFHESNLCVSHIIVDFIYLNKKLNKLRIMLYIWIINKVFHNLKKILNKKK